jgi:hypothetical protein
LSRVRIDVHERSQLSARGNDLPGFQLACCDFDFEMPDHRQVDRARLLNGTVGLPVFHMQIDTMVGVSSLTRRLPVDYHENIPFVRGNFNVGIGSDLNNSIQLQNGFIERPAQFAQV